MSMKARGDVREIRNVNPSNMFPQPLALYLPLPIHARNSRLDNLSPKSLGHTQPAIQEVFFVA